MTRELNIVLPVRKAKSAKNRLSPLLNQQQRKELSVLLFRQSLNFYRNQWPDIQLTVITDSNSFKCEAEHAGAFVLSDPGCGLNSAVNFATEYSMKQGFSRQLVVHSDIAVLDREEIAQLVENRFNAPFISAVPATADGGTNALLEQPPGIIKHCYGSGSFAKHVEAASSVGLKLNVLKLSKCGLDLDTSKDIFLYLRNYPDEAIAIQLFEWGITESAS